MLQNAHFRQRLLSGEKLIGTLSALPSSEVVELLSLTGFDWLFLDAEHGAYGPETIIRLLQAAGNCPCLVRIPEINTGWIKKVLDAGAGGIIVPQVRTVEDVLQVITFSKYTPIGQRGVGLGRAHGYGSQFSEYLQNGNAQTVIVIQAETREAIINIDSIAAVPEVDAVLIGPYDLSASLGVTGQIDHPSVLEAIAKVRSSCLKHNKRLGIFGVTSASVRPYREQDFTLITVGVDSVFLHSAAASTLAELRSA